jgi:hypothetical protein
MRSLILVVVAFLTLAGCQQSASVRGSGQYVHLEGRQVTLHLPLPVAAGKARVFLQQDGPQSARVMASGFDQYRPHCAFEIRSVDHQGVEIAPDTFQIVRVQRSLQQVVDSGSMQLAATQLALVGLWGGRSAYHEGYHFMLYSERQPDVMRMSCYGVYAEPPDLAPPTLPEIRAALGQYASITSAG